MKRSIIIPMNFLILLCGLSTLLSCHSTGQAARHMPESKLLSVSYSEWGTMIQPEFVYRLRQEADGNAWCLTFSHKSTNYEKYSVDSALLDSARLIIQDYKMYAYKDHYMPMMEVLDGYSWGFGAQFADGSLLSSGGSNSGPNNGGLNALESFFKRVIKGGKFICRTDKEGHPIPTVPDSLLTAEYADTYYISSNAWTSNVPSFSFRDSITNIQQSIHTSIEDDRCWGVQVIESQDGEPMLYLIMDDGYVERVSLRQLTAGQSPATTRSRQHDIVRLDIQTQGGKTVIVGYDKDDHAVVMEW